MTQLELVAAAHASLCLNEAPYLKHYKDGRFREWNGVALTGSHLPGPGFNFAAVLRPHSPSFDELLPIARDFFAVAKDGWGVLVEGDAGHPMEAELIARGWAVAEDEPAFVLPDISRRAGNGRGVGGEPVGGSPHQTAPPPVDSLPLAIRRVTNEADMAAYIAVTMAAFQAPPEFAEMMLPSLAYALDPDQALFVGSVDGADVTAVGYARIGPTALVLGTATLDEHRGRGYGAAVVRAALEHGARNGCTTASLRSGPKSVPLYERVGFRFACRHRTYAFPG